MSYQTNAKCDRCGKQAKCDPPARPYGWVKLECNEVGGCVQHWCETCWIWVKMVLKAHEEERDVDPKVPF